jgi:hypothetical protein
MLPRVAKLYHLESTTNMHIAADLHVHPWFSTRTYLESHECRERPKKYTTFQISQRLSRLGCIAQIECMPAMQRRFTVRSSARF